VIALAAVSFVMSAISVAMSLTLLRLVDRITLEQAGVMLPQWWWAHLSADLLLVPLLLTWLARNTGNSSRRPPSIGEMFALCACVFVVDVALFTGVLRSWFPGTAVPFYLLPLLLWAGMRFGTRGAATASFAVGMMAIASATTSHSPFSQVEDLESFVSLTAVATLVLSAATVERRFNTSRSIRSSASMRVGRSSSSIRPPRSYSAVAQPRSSARTRPC
jgi:integral membrane sensor domain MASE1